MDRTRCLRLHGATAVVACVFFALPLRAEPALQPEALAILRSMTTHLAGLERFSIQTDNALDVVLESGQKLQFENPARVTVARPNKLRAERAGDLEDQVLVYDGETLSLYDRGRGYYATVAAPPTLEEALDFARTSLDLVAPAADLLYANAYDVLTEDAQSAMVVGEGLVSGVPCHHLAFAGTEVDWQIWVEEGDRPLPRKLVITSKQIQGAPEFTVWMRSFDLAPRIADDAFAFSPPEDAEEIPFLQPTGPLGATVPATPGETR